VLDFKITYYIGIIIFLLLLTIFGWGWYTFNKPKTTTRFLNLKLIITTLVVGTIGLIISIIPIIMQVWTYSTDWVKSDATFITLLVFEYTFLVIFLGLAYFFSFDFGIAIDENKIYFFGQAVNTSKIIALDQRKYVLKIVYEQGIKKMKRRLTIFTPKAQSFVKDHLTEKVATNIKLTGVAENINEVSAKEKVTNEPQ